MENSEGGRVRTTRCLLHSAEGRESRLFIAKTSGAINPGNQSLAKNEIVDGTISDSPGTVMLGS